MKLELSKHRVKAEAPHRLCSEVLL